MLHSVCRCAAFAISLIALVTSLPAAVSMLVPGTGFVLRMWQTEDGLPQNTVTAIVQTRDGYLWLGSYGGLARFDGVRFQTFNPINTPELADGRVVSLHEDRHGTLWIGHDGGGVTRFRAGRFSRVESSSSHARERAVAIDSDDAGDVWLLRRSGVLESVSDGSVVPGQMRPAGPQLLALARGAGGELHVANDGEISLLADGSLRLLDFGPARISGFAMNIGPARGEGVWIVRDWRVQKWAAGRLVEDRGPCPWGGETSLSVLLETREGALAVGTMDRGLYLFKKDGRLLHFDRENGLPQNWVRSLCEDREGNLWIGAGSAGLVELVRVPFAVSHAPDQWQGRAELALAAARDGSLWVGTEGAGLYRLHEDEWTAFGQEQGLEHPFVWSLAEVSAGDIWVGTWGGGIFRLQGDRFVRWPEYDPADGPVLALQPAPDGQGLWIGSGSGLLRWLPGRSQAVERVVACDGNVTTIAVDGAGAIWFGVADGGLGCVEGEQVRRFRREDGLSSDAVQCLLADDDGSLWIGTADGGLNRLKSGRFASVTLEQGLASNAICHIADDRLGHLWLSTHHGILRLSKAELNAVADGRAASVSGQVFDRSDGLPTVEFSGGHHAAGCRSADGRLWFASSKGVVSVDPARLQLNSVEAPVVLEALYVDGRRVGLANGPDAGIELRPEHQRIEFRFTALSLSAPAKVIFNYRLDGIDEGWVEAGTRRSANYSHLSAGRYRFHVVARNNDGLWAGQGASLVFTVRPFFWQTWWFGAAVAVLVLAAVVWAVRHFTRRRLQRRLQELERRHALERERARIAQDIHDDVGASLTRISMLSQCVVPGRDASDGTAAVLDDIFSTAREMTRALDEIVWAVDPRHDSLDSLVCYMGKYAQDLLGAAGIRCRLDLPVTLPACQLTAEVRHNLFLAFKEALNNVLRHAAATEVHVALRLNAGSFVLSVTDNGRGFRPGVAGGEGGRLASGHGLENMRRRLDGLGGACEISAGDGGGARVAFVVALPGMHLLASADVSETRRSAE